jgi:predicted nucleic acid-binding protein
MLVVADSSPINALVCIDRVEVLPRLFEIVAIPTEVANELSRSRTPQRVKEFIASPPSWLIIREPIRIEPIAKLDAGEQAAISLASELRADFLLIDEQAGRRAATERKLPVVGTIGILERAAERGLLDLKETFALLKSTSFFVSDVLIGQVLARHYK